jgi:hypothetical protein
MDIVKRVKQTGAALALATGITVGFGAAQALAECTVIMCAPNGQTLNGKDQCVGQEIQIGGQTGVPANSPKDAWERVCTGLFNRWKQATIPYGAVVGRQEMVCYGDWRGHWCKDEEKPLAGGGRRNIDIEFGKRYWSLGTYLKDAKRAFTTSSTQVEVTVQAPVVVAPKVQVQVQGGTQVPAGSNWNVFKCNC